MPYERAKVYFDGSHYVAIPHTSGKKRLKRKLHIESEPEAEIKIQEGKYIADKKVDLKQEFNRIYKENVLEKKRIKKEKCMEGLLPFMDEKEVAQFVDKQFERKQRNLTERRKRMVRKANLHPFNYFCTFTYDSAKLSEEQFKKKLRNCLRNLCNRKGWQYMGVWERSKIGRLHFHGLFDIPDLVGELVLVKDYSTTSHKMQETLQNTYFTERFGRNDFHPLHVQDTQSKNECIRYLLKYIEKTEKRIVYSRGLNTYFISDVTEDDVICTFGVDDRKLVLADNFICWREWEYMGKVSSEVIKQMPKSN